MDRITDEQRLDFILAETCKAGGSGAIVLKLTTPCSGGWATVRNRKAIDKHLSEAKTLKTFTDEKGAVLEEYRPPSKTPVLPAATVEGVE